MPLQTTTPTLTNTLRSKLANPFDEEERKKLLGNNSALQSQLDTLSGSLGAFDATAERGARTGLLEQQAQQARENIARTFALDPSGIQTGSAIRPFSAIEGARLSNLAALESELSQRAGAENRANLGALQSLQGQQQGLNLNAGGLQLQGLGQLQNQIQFDAGQGLSREQLAQQDSQFGRGLTEQGRQFDIGQQFAIEQSLGNIGGIDTLANRQLTNQITLNNRASDLQEQVALGNLSLAEASQALQSDIQRGQLGLSERQLAQQGTQFEQSLAEQAAAREASNRLAEGNLLGNLGGQDTLASQQLAAQLGLDTQRLQEQIAARQSQEGLQTRALDEQVVARQEANALQRLGLTGEEGGTQTIALQQLKQQDAQFGAELSQRAQQFAQQYGLQEAELFGGTPSVNFKMNEIQNMRIGAGVGDADYRAEFDTNKDGQFTFEDMIEIGANSVDLGNGVMQYVPENARRTLQQQQLDNQKAQFAQQFGLEQQKVDEASTQFQQQLAQAKREFQSTFQGVLSDENGNAAWVWDGSTWVRPTSVQAQQFSEQKRQFNQTMAQNAEQFVQSLGIQQQQLANDERTAIANMLIGAAGVLGKVDVGQLLSNATGGLLGGGAAGAGGAAVGGAGLAGVGAAVIPVLAAERLLSAITSTPVDQMSTDDLLAMRARLEANQGNAKQIAAHPEIIKAIDAIIDSRENS